MTATPSARARPARPRAAVVAAVVVLGAVMSILDTTVVNVAINTLARDFNTTLPTIQWVVTGYTLALATVIPATGWAADRFGTKRLYMLSITLFLAGSLLSGIAWSAESLIGFRVLQGLGGGMLMPLGMTILTRAAGPGRVGRVMSIIGVPMLLGPILGPILGGWLVDDVSWRWIFFINLPIGIAALTLASARAPARHARSAARLRRARPGAALPRPRAVHLRPGEVRRLRRLRLGPGAGPRNRRRRPARAVRAPRAAGGRAADRPRAVPQPHVRGGLGHARAVRDRGLRLDAAAAALPAGRARRVRAQLRAAARPAGPRRDARDADRRAAHRPHRHRPDRARRHDADPRRDADADPDRRGDVLLGARRGPVRVRHGDGLDDDADHVRRDADAAPGRRSPARARP